jgi:DNA-binding response OmpR family regulator
MNAGEKPKVLCVEDNEDECELIREILRAYEVTCVSTVAEACPLLDETEFALVILDEHLPDGSGMELCGQISRKNADTPVIMVSGDTYITAAEAAEAGARALLMKTKTTFVEELGLLARNYVKSATA